MDFQNIKIISNTGIKRLIFTFQYPVTASKMRKFVFPRKILQNTLNRTNHMDFIKHLNISGWEAKVFFNYSGKSYENKRGGLYYASIFFLICLKPVMLPSW